MVTRKDVRIARKAFDKLKYNDKLTKDELNILDSMIADYEFRYDI